MSIWKDFWPLIVSVVAAVVVAAVLFVVLYSVYSSEPGEPACRQHGGVYDFSARRNTIFLCRDGSVRWR